LDDYRVNKAPPLKRIVIAVDPAVTSGENSNETGIIACGLGSDGHGYVLDDDSGIYQPEEMGRRVVAMFRKWEADKVVIEVNNGGDYFRAVLRSVAANLPVQQVRATRGKFVRAEPVSALYEQGRCHHVGNYAALEDQMTVFTSDRLDMTDRGYASPDRVDALVWGMTSLFPQIAESSRQDKGIRDMQQIAIGTGEVEF
jgi:phage terminase large subunit-like protein